MDFHRSINSKYEILSFNNVYFSTRSLFILIRLSFSDIKFSFSSLNFLMYYLN